MSRATRVPALALLAVTVCLPACRGSAPPDATAAIDVLRPVLALDTPAGPGSLAPGLARGADGRLYLSWIEPAADDGHVLRFATWAGQGWSAPSTVARGKDWFVNWADVPGMAALADGTLAASWLVKSADATYAYDVQVAVSRDAGATWSATVSPHDDGTPTEHGFVSLVPTGNRFSVVWLDGRRTGDGGAMTLRRATLDRTGNVTGARIVDERVCDCCPTAAAAIDDGSLIVAYRDRSEGEIRDIFVARLDGKEQVEPYPIHADGWLTQACPVNGPALAGGGPDLACAWFTMKDGEQPRVHLARSDDRGRSFGAPLRLDDGSPMGRVGLAETGDGALLVSWLEKTASGAAIRVRRVLADGTAEDGGWRLDSGASRSSGIPRIAVVGDQVVLAWTEPGDSPRVRTGLLSI